MNIHALDMMETLLLNLRLTILSLCKNPLLG